MPRSLWLKYSGGGHHFQMKYFLFKEAKVLLPALINRLMIETPDIGLRKTIRIGLMKTIKEDRL